MLYQHPGILRYCLFTLTLLAFSGFAKAQDIQNVKAELQGNQIIVTYDLVNAQEDQTFEVMLFSSANKFLSPVEKVSGDVGADVKPGTNRSINWNASEELVRFRGELTFEVRALVFTPYVDFVYPQVGDAMKRGKTNTIEWIGGNTTDQLLLELYQNGSKLQTIETTANTGQFTWIIPEIMKPGKDYQVKISSANQPANFALSKLFVIKRKIPLGLKLLPIALIGGAAGTLLGVGDPVPEPRPDRIADPPNPQ